MNVHALSPARQRGLAFLMLIGAVAAGYLLVAQPVASAFGNQSARIDKAQADLARWQGVIASESDIAAAASTINHDPRLDQGTLQASSDTQAAAGLQSLVRKALINAGADVRSTQILQSDESGSMDMVGVRVVIMATHEQFERAVMAIENSKPYLYIREADLQLSASSRRASAIEQAPQLQIRLDIFAFARTGE